MSIARSTLFHLIVSNFSDEELRTLCFHLNVDYDILPGRGKAAKVRDLIILLERQGKPEELIIVIGKERPHLQSELRDIWPGWQSLLTSPSPELTAQADDYLSQFAQLHAELDEWKELHNLLHRLHASYALCRRCGFLIKQGKIRFHERFMQKKLIEAIATDWQQCKSILIELKAHAISIERIGPSYDVDTGSGPDWFLVIDGLSKNLNRSFLNVRSNPGRFQFANLLLEFGNEVEQWLYLADKDLRKVVQQIKQLRHVTAQPTAFTHSTLPLTTSPASNTPNVQIDSILIVTVTKVEAQAVLDEFSQAANMGWTRQVIGKKTYYNLGAHGGAPIFMVQSEPGIATPGGALLTVRRAIQDLHPQAVIMCGIAFGSHPDKQHLGDILVAKQIQYYAPQKVDMQQGQMPRGDRATSAERLLDRFRSGDIDWPGAPRHFGLVLSGEILVNDPTFRDRILEAEPEAVGGEMEGAGLYAAARDAKVDWILVKAICDWADGKKNDDAHRLAASNAAQFVLHVLQLGGWSEAE